MPNAAEANTLKLHVTSTVGAGTPTELDVNPDDTVRAVIEQVATAQAIDPNSISLVKNGKPLDLVSYRQFPTVKSPPIRSPQLAPETCCHSNNL